MRNNLSDSSYNQNFVGFVGKSTVEETESFPPEREQILKGLSILSKMDLGWDSEEAVFPETASIRTAEFFIENLPSSFSYPDVIAPGMEGSIILKWNRHPEGSFFMTIDGPQMYLSIENAGGFEELASDKYLGIIPQAIKNNLPKK